MSCFSHLESLLLERAPWFPSGNSSSHLCPCGFMVILEQASLFLYLFIAGKQTPTVLGEGGRRFIWGLTVSLSKSHGREVQGRDGQICLLGSTGNWSFVWVAHFGENSPPQEATWWAEPTSHYKSQNSLSSLLCS